MKRPDINELGIMPRYRDAAGKSHELSQRTADAFSKAMGVSDGIRPKARPHSSPGKRKFTRCYLPKDLKTWGWSVQLYSLRSNKSWGIGDFADLRNFARWSARKLKAGFLLVNPLGAAMPVLPQQASPYYPSSRLFKSPLYLCIAEIPGANRLSAALKRLAQSARELNKDRFINRDAVFELKMQALEYIWENTSRPAAFARFCKEQGRPLETFANFCVLAEYHGSGWQQWPPEFKDPDSTAVKDFCAQRHERVRFFQWLQWLCDQQLARAAKEIALMQDLPVGADPGGADAWMWQKFFAHGISVGAPPDEFNTQGQNWGLQPFIPQKLRAADYEPFRLTIRAALRHARGLRIDHVMGLFRLFWIPQDGSAADGAYVRYPAEELLEIIASESRRAKAIIVGEDLGTVEEGVREAMDARNMPGYRLMWFEKGPLKQLPRKALSAVTTHDLFTIAGLWTGSDLGQQNKIGLRPNVESTRQTLKHLQEGIGLKEGAPMENVIERTYALLAKAPSMLLTAALEDALAVEERPNMPGTTTQWPNWSIALPESLEAIQKKSLPKKIARALNRQAAKSNSGFAH